jgi:hypothetical protein
MSRDVKLLALAVLAVLLSSDLFAADPATSPKSFRVAKHADLVLNVPKDWTQSTEQGPVPGLPPTIKFSAAGGQFEMLVTPMTAQNGNADFASPANVKKLAEAQGKRMLSGSKEKSLDLQEIKGDKATGYYFTLTDKAPDPGSFEYMTSAHVGVGDLLVTATMLHHQKDLPQCQAGLAMLKSATQKPADPAAKAGSELRVASPDSKWQLLVPGQGLEIVDDQSDAARKARQVTGTSQITGLTVSVFIEPAQKPGDSTVARSVYWNRAKQSPIPKKNVRLAKTGEAATVDYTMDQMEGLPLNQKNLNVYLVHEGAWIDVHVSKTGYTDKDKPLFDQIINGVKFEPTR